MLGGAPLNVAWHLRALGLHPAVVSRVGDDAPGRDVLGAMRGWSLDTTGVQVDPLRATGAAIGLLYHGTLALRQRKSLATLAALRAALAVPVFVDVNLRDPWWDGAVVADALDGARWAKLNADELTRLAGTGDETEGARRLMLRHGLERVFVTLGGAGAIAVTAAGDVLSVIPPGTAVVDTVGAGDAFAAVLIFGLLADWPLAPTLERAQALATVICGLRGAVPDDPAVYRGLASAWGV